MLIQRFITGALFGAAVIAGVLLLPTPGAAAVLAVLFVAGAWEWAGLARIAGGRARLLYTALPVAVMITAGVWIERPGVVQNLLLAALAFWGLAFAAVVSYPRRPLPLGAVGAAGFIVLLPAWVALVHLHGGPSGPGLVMTVIAVVWSADIGAFFAGRTLGRRKLAPHVSPGKTWEGVAGGVVLASLVAGAAAPTLGLPIGRLVAVGGVTALASVLGDLTVSVGKRNIGVKDTGRLLPGHGGMLDRIDSLTAAAPVFVLGLLAAGLVH